MSHPLSEQTVGVCPNESISQVSAFAVDENEEDEEDIYGEPFSVHPGSSSEFRSVKVMIDDKDDDEIEYQKGMGSSWSDCHDPLTV